MDLADAITLLREQIIEAQTRTTECDENHQEGVLFGLGEITLELGMELTRTQGVDGGLRFSVASLGGKKEGSVNATHKVTLQLNPHRPDGGDIDVSDKE
ncbi:trypco2 family protein [Streptomyces sp. ODS28]|uniref:trypco2 family protein n=1 Tax=Streptomyces sp. ODS28 TaxID=3136688 RepID=UPI0031EC8950